MYFLLEVSPAHFVRDITSNNFR